MKYWFKKKIKYIDVTIKQIKTRLASILMLPMYDIVHCPVFDNVGIWCEMSATPPWVHQKLDRF